MTPTPDPLRAALEEWFGDLNNGLLSLSSGRFALGSPGRNADAVLALIRAALAAQPDDFPLPVLALDLSKDTVNVALYADAALAPAPPLDVERLAEAIGSVAVYADGTLGTSVTADNAEAIAREYAALSEPKP